MIDQPTCKFSWPELYLEGGVSSRDVVHALQSFRVERCVSTPPTATPPPARARVGMPKSHNGAFQEVKNLLRGKVFFVISHML